MVIFWPGIYMWNLFWNVPNSCTGNWIVWIVWIFWTCTKLVAMLPSFVGISCVTPSFWIFLIGFCTFIMIRRSGQFDYLVDHSIVWLMRWGFIPFLTFSSWRCLWTFLFGFSNDFQNMSFKISLYEDHFWCRLSWTFASFAVTMLPSFASIGCIAERFYIVRICKGTLIVIYIPCWSFQI